ncbi:hypothetical protein [Bacillus sp. JJ722]|uniref:hypothetical protein n=1 Tax=Bacillus sp. JJ722 TaxID=3122973 RepID=UPI003000EDCF
MLIVFSIYLCIGLLIGYYRLKDIDDVIEDYENGEEMIDEELQLLDSITQLNNTLGGKSSLIVFYVVHALFWLPIESNYYVKKFISFFKKED